MDNFRAVKYIAFSIEILLVFIVQDTPYLLPEVFGGKAVLLVPTALSIAIFEDEIPSVLFGALCGMLIDSGYSGPVGFYAIALSLICYTVSFLMANRIRTNMLTVMIVAFVSIPVLLLLQFVFYYVFADYDHAFEFFVKHYISRIIYTLVFVPVFYKLNKFIAVRLSSK